MTLQPIKQPQPRTPAGKFDTDKGKKPAKTTPAVVKSYTPMPHGFLVDNNGLMHDLSKIAVTALEKGGIKPASHQEFNGKQLPVWATDEGGDRYTTTSSLPTVNDCVYRAIKKYVEALGLGTLTQGDEVFFKTHPRVSSDGVNKANVLAVAHGLVVPWGLGITRVWVPKLSSLGEQHIEFATALGINPMGLSSYNVSNEDLITMLELEKYGEQATMIRDTYRFEFVGVPAGPCVVMLSSSTQVKTKTGGANVAGKWTTTTYGMGHADFVGPRDNLYGKWEIAFQIGRLPIYNDNKINRYQKVEDAFADELKEQAKAQRKFSTWTSLVNGKSINTWDIDTRNPAVKTGKVVQKTLPATTTKGGTGNGSATFQKSATPCRECGGVIAEVDGWSYCLSCNWYDKNEDTDAIDVSVERVCPICYGPTTTDGICVDNDCGYDPAEWDESNYFICSKHNVPLFFKVSAPQKYLYICAECLFAADRTIAQEVELGKGHPKELTKQIKEFNKKKEDDNGDSSK